MIVATSLFPNVASADDVDIAVDAFAKGEALVGVSPGPEATDLIKVIVRCAINKTAVLVCARNEVASRLPVEVRPLVTCIISQGAFEKCATQQAFSSTSPQVRDLAICVATDRNLGRCASLAGSNVARQSGLEMVEKLKADGRSELGEAAPGQIRNIINVVEGISSDDWGKVFLYGGAVVYKLVAKAVLQIVLTPELAQVISPVVDAVVQSRVDLVVGLIKAIKKRDEPQISRLVVEFYLIAHVEIPCALFNNIPGSDAVKEAICGTLGTAIHTIGSATSDIVQSVENTLVNAGINPLGVFGDRCGTAGSFYASRYAVCLKQSASLNITNPGLSDQFTASLNQSCRKNFEPCESNPIVGGTTGRINKQCDPLRDHFVRQTAALADGIRGMAASFARLHRVDILKKFPDGICNVANAGGLLGDCAAALRLQSPGLAGANWARCDGAGLPSPDIFRGACQVEMCRIVTPRAVFCLKYADEAVLSQKDVRDIKCDPNVISGPRWSANHDDHLQFCLSSNAQAVNSEIDARQRISQQCHITAGMPHGTPVLSIHQGLAKGEFTVNGSKFQANARVVLDISGPAARAQTITNQLSDEDGDLTIELSHSEVCAWLGPVTFVARQGDNIHSEPATVTCQPCASAQCNAPAPVFTVTDPHGQTSLLVKGTGFSPHVSIAISLSSSASRLPQPQITTNADGSFELSLPTKDVCLKPGWLSVGVSEEGRPPLQAIRVSCDAPAPDVCNADSASCVDGYVWRNAGPDDKVCVSQGNAWLANRENSVASATQRRLLTSIRNARGRPPVFVCNDGYVARNAFNGDAVCVLPAAAARVKKENEEAVQHLACSK